MIIALLIVEIFLPFLHFLATQIINFNSFPLLLRTEGVEWKNSPGNPLTLKKNFWRTVLLSGLLVGTLDITAALVQFYIKTGKDPLIVPKYIASAVFGKDAYAGGNQMVVYGFLFHYLIAFIWTLFFFFIYPRLNIRSWNRVVAGVLYGLFIWVIMNRVVVPMSKAPVSAFNLKQAVIAALILIAAIGLPLSFIAHRFYSSRLRS